jgi:sec-independent protein translocase protein TatB
MIEISFGKLILLALVALIVLGPEKLPGAARTAGALLRRVRTGWDSVRAEVERELQVEEIRRQAREASEKATAAQAELDATLRKMQPVGNAAVSPAPAPAPSEAPVDTDAPVIGTTPSKEATHGGV